MRKPAKRPNLPARRSNNEKRRLLSDPEPSYISKLQQNIIYQGSPKHKQNPRLFGLPAFRGNRGDATLCDRDANFQQKNMNSIPGMIRRGLEAGLVGENGVIWAVADDGWIYEGRMTNVTKTEYHGYPVRSTEPIAEMVYQRFKEWVEDHGNESARQAARQCRTLYGFRQ